MVFVLTELAIFSRDAVSSSPTQELSVSLLLHRRWLSSFGCLRRLLLLQHEVMEPLIKVGVLFPVLATQNNPGEGDEGKGE